MKFCLSALIVCFWLFYPGAIQAYDIGLHDTPVSVYFSPRGGAQQAIVDAIGQAKKTLYVQAYSFTSAPIAKALVDASRRGVKVEALLDKSQRKATYTGATFLKNEGIPVWIDDKHAIAHNKVMIIDGVIVVTGSFNFTKAAEEKNAENLLIIRDPGLAKLYMDNWDRHREHSEEY
ncbi:phospholipase D family protein [Solidesulfovibrio magneticus]|uniref:phospholipase D n=1 Tax=Solidesulfovibrio magneticus (strain ATCC 700980 / DSM 13731 / RS-1) TaxID=573370 RepID=C4XJK4_SOLM1|nr:phospholipase D family protein [Solidesulfovibrio magneticus]BAH76751.1 putative nuclease [Solidesulfovibrio magneticus RS-1]